MQVELLHCHSFIPDLLKHASVAVDAGANAGDFSKWLSENTTAHVYSFEPDPRLFPELPDLNRVEWLEMAIDGKSGSLELRLGEGHCSSGVYSEAADQEVVTVPKVSLEDFCHNRGIDHIDFLKIDIEGAELSVLEQASDGFLQGITQITVEFHDFLNIEDVPRIKNIFSRMHRLGFFGVRFSHHTWGDCLFVNKQRAQLSLFSQIRIKLAGKYLRGMSRKLTRLIKQEGR